MIRIKKAMALFLLIVITVVCALMLFVPNHTMEHSTVMEFAVFPAVLAATGLAAAFCIDTKLTLYRHLGIVYFIITAERIVLFTIRALPFDRSVVLYAVPCVLVHAVPLMAVLLLRLIRGGLMASFWQYKATKDGEDHVES